MPRAEKCAILSSVPEVKEKIEKEGKGVRKGEGAEGGVRARWLGGTFQTVTSGPAQRARCTEGTNTQMRTDDCKGGCTIKEQSC